MLCVCVCVWVNCAVKGRESHSDSKQTAERETAPLHHTHAAWIKQHTQQLLKMPEQFIYSWIIRNDGSFREKWRKKAMEEERLCGESEWR